MPTKKQVYFSPLRYPGGKRNFVPFFLNIFQKSKLDVHTYYEFYAGGAAAALQLLLNGDVKKIVLNDADYHIYAFWYAILHDTDIFLRKIADTNVTIEEWHRQRYIYNNFENEDLLTVAFSTFFLNRTNRSGILAKAGPIGGLQQNGNYKLDVRFNKENLTSLIKKIALHRDRIDLYNKDAIELMKKLKFELNRPNSFLFLDPPYFEKGEDLYLNFYKLKNHIDLKKYLENHLNWNWVLSYDNCSTIMRLYKCFPKRIFQIQYSLQDKKNAKEIVIFSNSLIESKKKRDIFIFTK